MSDVIHCALVALVLATAGCSPGSGDDAKSSELDRLPSATFPFPLANDSHTLRDDGGIFVGQSLYYANKATPVFERPGLPIAIAALPDRLAVAFAAGDRVGFDLAYAGADIPWTREHLNDVARIDFGAIDAIAANDGSAYIAFRNRQTDDITLYHWRAGRPLEAETVPRPVGHRRAQWRDRCPDLTLAMSRAGDLDLLFLQADPTYRLVRARKAAATGAWTIDEVATAATGKPPPGSFLELGCKSKMTYDADDAPMVLTLGRLIPNGTADVIGGERDPGEPLPIGTLSPPPPLLFQGYYLDTDGAWHAASPTTSPTRSHGPFASVPAENGGSMGSFDLEVNPGGFVISGPYVEFHSATASNGGQLSLPVASIAQVAPASYGYSKAYPTHTLDGQFATVAFGELDKITFDSCGALTAYGLDRNDIPLEISLMGAGSLVCPSPHAPVRGPSALGSVPIWAHGRRAYDAMMCLTGPSRTLSVCANAYPDGVSVTPDAELPKAVGVDAIGEIETTRAMLTVTLSRDLAAGEQTDVMIASLAGQPNAQYLINGPHAAAITVQMPALVAGTPYSVVVLPHGPKGLAADFAHRRPVFDFRVAATP